MNSIFTLTKRFFFLTKKMISKLRTEYSILVIQFNSTYISNIEIILDYQLNSNTCGIEFNSTSDLVPNMILLCFC